MLNFSALIDKIATDFIERDNVALQQGLSSGFVTG
jgi:hypothetical protein